MWGFFFRSKIKIHIIFVLLVIVCSWSENQPCSDLTWGKQRHTCLESQSFFQQWLLFSAARNRNRTMNRNTNLNTRRNGNKDGTKTWTSTGFWVETGLGSGKVMNGNRNRNKYRNRTRNRNGNGNKTLSRIVSGKHNGNTTMNRHRTLNRNKVRNGNQNWNRNRFYSFIFSFNPKVASTCNHERKRLIFTSCRSNRTLPHSFTSAFPHITPDKSLGLHPVKPCSFH